jgi:hypothetical protein
MDPNATLADIRAALARIRVREAEPDGVADLDTFDRLNDDDYQIIADGFESLDEWISRGGFLPSAWQH